MSSEPHLLVRLTYAPRVLVYTLTSAILATRLEAGATPAWLVALIVYSLAYPHALVALASSRIRTRGAALALQHLDAFHVGVYCGAVHFAPMPVTAFLTSLVLSDMLLGGLRCVLAGIPFVAAGIVVCGTLTGWHLDATPALTTGLLSGAVVLLYAGLVAHTGFEQIGDLLAGSRRISHANIRLMGMTDRLRRYIAPQIYSSMFAQEAVCETRTERKQLAVFFSDIEGFTELTEALEAGALARLLNGYLAEMAEIAMRHGGTVDKFIGDGIMIFFGDPYTRGPREDALGCVRMALEMRARMRSLREEWTRDGLGRGLHVRIGIHSGLCTVGNFGCDARLDYTIVGGTVNLASRLEGLAGPDEILVSAEVRALVGEEFVCTLVPGVAVKGFPHPLDLYRVE